MVRNRPLIAVAIPAVVAVAALAAGCGGSGNGDSTSAPTHPKAATGQPVTVGLASIGGLGKVLVDSTGQT
ncbi:MAG TPA: hypothetical protein VMC78_24140, partial [Mycobacterium sp.]|nr:hypothetical protein [Mycobacterium sp.]